MSEHDVSGGSGPEPPILDSAMLAEVSAGDEEIVAELVSLFTLESRRQVDELSSAVATRDGDAVRRLTHSLKGASLSIGAVRLASVANELFEAAVGEQLDALAGLYSRLRGDFDQTLDALAEIDGGAL